MSKGVLAILGSGETAPGMTKVHRELLQRVSPARAVNLDSAYGFQLNVPQMSEKLEEYFDVSLQTKLETLHLTSYEQATELERTIFRQQVRGANYVFAGPGSPTYALAQWKPLELNKDLLAVLADDGTACFASAAALTLGAFTAPIYEIYKVGVNPYWLEGLNVMASFGLNCVVIPHFDNAEGGNYDTRFCYLGEPRLKQLERLLPEGTATLGVDEHTAVIFNFAEDTLTVQGRANGYWRVADAERMLENGTTVKLDELRNAQISGPNLNESNTQETEQIDPASPESLGEVVLAGGRHAIEALASLVQLAKSGGSGKIDPTSLINDVLDVRRTARELGQYQLSDQLRDALMNASIAVNDGVTGTTWSLN